MDTPPLIYVGSSWKNMTLLDDVHACFEDCDMVTWDFRKNGFWWQDVAPRYLEDPYRFLSAPQSEVAFEYDKRGMDSAVAGFFVLPAGVATALEAGYMSGLGKPTFVWGLPREPRLDIIWKVTTKQLHWQEYSLMAAVEEVKRTLNELAPRR